jgi:hypothetical protein
MTTQKPLRDQIRQIMAEEMGSLTPQEWARLFVAGRAGLVAGMTDEGIPGERVEQLMDAWDDEADRRGLPPESPGYWDQAPEWIREQARLPGK